MQLSPLHLIRQMRNMREQERALFETNPFLAEALEQEKREGHRLALMARTIALIIIMVLLPIISPRLDILFYEVIILLFIGIGWLQYRCAKTGYNKYELALIALDIILLTITFTVPNPFIPGEIPTTFLYQFENFSYFYIFLALGTLAYSWRTVWAIGTWICIAWIIGAVLVNFLGTHIPELDIATQEAFANYPMIAELLNPSSMGWGFRLQEVVILIIIAAILTIRGYRSNLLLIKQAKIAAERANLSRYFPSTIVDTLASNNRDIGAVKSQEVVVLFTDIVGFTDYAERNEPEEVMGLLRRYHEIIERCVFENNGTLEKYLGDGVMATFGRPENNPRDAANALSAAQQILIENDKLNSERIADNKEPIAVSIGIHHGPVILGDIGPERQLEFAVVGDTVNVAARLEAESRPLKCRCVVSDEVFQKLDEAWPERDNVLSSFKSKGAVQLRGRSKPIHVWTT